MLSKIVAGLAIAALVIDAALIGGAFGVFGAIAFIGASGYALAKMLS